MARRAAHSGAANPSRMNETDFIRQQLHLEGAHLRELLHACAATERPAPAVAAYLQWAGPRLIDRVLAHHTALQDSAALAAPLRAQLSAAAAAARQAQAASGAQQSAPLRALLAAWSEPLDAAAGQLLRTAHWRRVAGLTADRILEERQLYAAAQASLGRS